MKSFMTSLALLASQVYSLQEGYTLLVDDGGIHEQKKEKLLADEPTWFVDTEIPDEYSCYMYTSTGFVVDPDNMTRTDDHDDDGCEDDNTHCAGRRIEISMKTNSNDDTEYIDTPYSFTGTEIDLFDNNIESFKCGIYVEIEICNYSIDVNSNEFSCQVSRLSTHTSGAVVQYYYKERNKASAVILRPAEKCIVKYDLH